MSVCRGGARCPVCAVSAYYAALHGADDCQSSVVAPPPSCYPGHTCTSAAFTQFAKAVCA